jgi:polysaccharide export outer membrane protein
MNSTQQSGAVLPSKNNHAVPLTRLAMALTLAAMLSACAFAPGQKMIMPPTLPETSTDAGDPVSEVQIPITTIDLKLIREQQAARMADTKTTNDLGLFAKPTPYKLGPGDVLQITVWDHPELAAALGQPQPNAKPSDAAPGFVVDGDGNIQFPYVTKPIHAAGKSAEQVQREIYADLSKVFVKPQVTVRVASFRSAQVYVDGEVRAPGAQSVNDIPMTLTGAVNRSGGFTPAADQSRVTIIRNGTSYPINVADMIARGKNPSDIMLQPGDMLHVDSREDNTVYVMGEVNAPKAVQPTHNGRLTLGEALSQAGDMNPNSADAKSLYVIRQATSDKPEIFHLDARSPVSMLLANQFDLQSKDVVYVDNSGLVRASRVLNLLLPAINAGLTAAIVTK